MNKKDSKVGGVPFVIGEVISSDEVPNWARREPKWQVLLDHIEKLGAGESLPVSFSTKKVAQRAANTIRDTINLKRGSAVIRTRVVPINQDDKEGPSQVFFTMLAPENVIQVERSKRKK